MNWITIVWSVLIGACVAMALPQVLSWIWQRRIVHLFFVILAAAVIALLSNELALMRSSSVEQFARVLQWRQLPLFVLFVAIIGFVRLYFGTGRWWLGITACGVRLACLVINFALPPNLYFREITILRPVYLLGDTVSAPVGLVSPWSHLTEISSLFLLAFVVDASISLWQQGKPEARRRAMIIGGSITSYEVLAAGLGMLVHLRNMPALAYSVSLPFVAIVAAMAFELSYDLFAALRVSQKLQLSEASLRESEERFRIVADSAPVLIWMSGLDKLCTFFNKPWLEFTGRTIEQEMGNGWAEGVHPDDFQRCLQTYVAAFDAREPFVMQYRLRHHDGEYRWISDNGVPRYDAQKNFAGYIGSCLDVTELVNKEQALRDSEERMSLAANAAGLIVWTWDIRRDEVSLSDKDRAFFGFSQREKLNGDRVRSIVHSEDRQFVRQLVENSLQTREEIEAEYRVVLPDGKVRWVARRGRVEFDGNDEPICERGVLMDITERKQAEEKFRLATEASPSGIILVNDRGRIVLVNSQIEKLFGYQREELVGKLVDILVPERLANQHPDHRAEFLAAPTARAMGAGRELFGRRKDGTEFPVEIGLNPIQAPDGILVLAAVVDISARKLAEAEAVQHREELGHLSRVAVTGELAASIAHELNQPLSAIISNASAGQRFIEGGHVDLSELRELLADIVADGRRAGDVIRGIQNMVRKRTPARQRVNLNDLVASVVRMVNGNAILYSCEVETLLDANLPAIEADPIQLQQVLLNLMINAFEAMRNMPISRRKVVIATERNGDDTICASVRDYGLGIPEEARERIFDHFFTTKAEGLGMGLAIVRSIVESHAGTIAAENVEGGGARFRFILSASAAAL
jgi:PAS domain S-box-containing protein